MSMIEWAKKEVELAKEHERKISKEFEGSYGEALFDYGSLFEYVYENGKLTYIDIDRSYCFDITKPDMRYSFGLVKNIIDEMFPIIMPYSPANERIKVCCEQFVYSPDGGDFDSVAILYVDDPDNKRINVTRYFKEEDNKWVEIEFTEHINRFQAYLTREGRVK